MVFLFLEWSLTVSRKLGSVISNPSSPILPPGRVTVSALNLYGQRLYISVCRFRKKLNVWWVKNWISILTTNYNCASAAKILILSWVKFRVILIVAIELNWVFILVHVDCWTLMSPQWRNSSKYSTNKVLLKKWSQANGSEMYSTRKQVSSYKFLSVLIICYNDFWWTLWVTKLR